MVLYVDSVPQSPTTYTTGLGVLAANTPMSIGSRRASSTTNYNYQFLGNINDVALYGYALSSNQVFNHYTAPGIGAHCTVAPPTTMHQPNLKPGRERNRHRHPPAQLPVV